MTDASEVQLECAEDFDEAASDARAGALFRAWDMGQIGDEDCSNPVRRCHRRGRRLPRA